MSVFPNTTLSVVGDPHAIKELKPGTVQCDLCCGSGLFPAGRIAWMECPLCGGAGCATPEITEHYWTQRAACAAITALAKES